MKKVRFYSSLAVFIGFLMCLCYYPLPYTVIAPTIVELRTLTDGRTTAQQVFVPDVKWSSQLREIHVKPGDLVEAGQVLAVLENPMLRMELIEAEGKVEELEQELESLETMRHSHPASVGRIGPTQQLLAAAQDLLESKQRDVESLTLRAPLAGIVVSPPWKPLPPLAEGQLPQWWGSPLELTNLNATLEPGTVVCSVGDPRFLEAILIIDQSKYSFVRGEQRVELKLHEFPDQIFLGEIAEVENQKITALEPQLSTSAGGEVPTTRQQGDGSEEPNRASFRARMSLENNPDLSIRVGMTGISKVHVDPQTLGYRLWLTVNETFNFKL